MGSKRPCLAFLMLVLLRNCVALSVEEEALYNQVLVPGYSKSSPPRTADNKTDVFIQLEVIFVGDVRESWLDFKLNAWVSLLWRDSRVDATLLRQLGHRTMPEFLARSVWQPSVVFESAGQVTRFDESDVYVRDDDFLLLRQRIVFHVLCLAQEDTFILGGTVCSLVVKLVHNADSAASLVWVGDDSASPFFGQHESIVLQEGIRPLSYRLVKVEPSQHEHEESSRAIGHPPAVTASFHFSKVTWSFLLSTYVPSTLVVVVSWMAFWVDVGAAASRVTLGVSCLLTLAAQVRHNRIASPYSSQLQPGDVWFFMSAVMVFCSLLEFVVAHNAYRAQVRAQNAGVTSASASSTSIADPRYHVYRKPPAMVALTVMCDVGSQTNRSYLAYRPNDVDMLARVIFPVAFVLVASGYFLWYAASDK
ncbi:gamma-aminobutyric acid receptor subunit rho-2-like isoform X1 [Haemaphysalis longicornis]